MRLELDGPTVCGVYCLHYLARKGAGARPGELAKASGMGRERIRRVLRTLSSRGFVAWHRREGWRLVRPPGEMTVGAVQEAVKRLPKTGAGCRVEYGTCPHKSVCVLSPVCRAVHEGAEASLHSSSVGDLAADPASLPVCVERRTRASRPS